VPVLLHSASASAGWSVRTAVRKWST
jgi:hypothetical protein